MKMGSGLDTTDYMRGDEVLDIDKKDIEQYLSEVKNAVGNDRYRIDRNSNRQD